MALELKTIQNLINRYSSLRIIDAGRGPGSFKSYKDYANHRISYNILRKATQLYNDLNSARIAKNAQTSDQVSDSILKILDLRAKALEQDSSQVRSDLRDFLDPKDAAAELRGSSLDKNI